MWFYFFSKYLGLKNWHCVIVDCFGNFNPTNFPGAEVVPFVNLHHGPKIDIFLEKFLTADLIFLCDDDKYIINSLDQAQNLLQDSLTAAVSLCHRTLFYFHMGDKNIAPMGSYALIFKRNLFAQEGLRLRNRSDVVSQYKVLSAGNKPDFSYDTADYANEQLLLRGYKIPTFSEGEFVLGFTGLSAAQIILVIEGAEKIKRAVPLLTSFMGNNGTVLNALYNRTKVEQFFRKIFKKEPAFASGFSADEVIALIKNNRFAPEKEKIEKLQLFSEIDGLFSKLKEKI